MKRVLLVGGSGQLGTAIARCWDDCEIVAPAHAELALENQESLRAAIERIVPHAIVNAAAFHDVDRCETEPERAFAVNAFAVGRAAQFARECGALFLTISSDYVFDGVTSAPYTERDTPHPLSAYGLSKLTGEYLALGAGAKTFVVRTCGLYGPAQTRSQRQTFIDRILTARRAGEPVRVVSDVVVSPTNAADLARALRRLIETTEYGLYHAVNAGAVTWYEFAAEALRQAGLDEQIEPIEARDWKAIAIRPRFSALDCAKLRRLGVEMPAWQAGIAGYLSVPVV